MTSPSRTRWESITTSLTQRLCSWNRFLPFWRGSCRQWSLCGARTNLHRFFVRRMLSRHIARRCSLSSQTCDAFWSLQGVRRDAVKHDLTRINGTAPTSHLGNTYSYLLSRVELPCRNQFHLHLISDIHSSQMGKVGLSFYCTFCNHFSPHADNFISQLCSEKHGCRVLGRAVLRIPEQFKNIGKCVYIKVKYRFKRYLAPLLPRTETHYAVV